MSWELALLAFAGPPIAVVLAGWLNSRCADRQRKWAVEDRVEARRAAHEDRELESAEHRRRWLREVRIAAYADLYAGSVEVVNQALHTQYASPEVEDPGALRANLLRLVYEHQQGAARVSLVGSLAVRAVAEDLRVKTLDRVDVLAKGNHGLDSDLIQARDAFLRAAQEELGVVDSL